MTLGNNIQKLRKQIGLSQEQLGEQVGVTRQTISNWESEQTSPNPEQLILLSKSLNISIDELLDNERKDDLYKKVSNTEQLAGMIMKILKTLGKLAIGYLIFVAILIVFTIVYTFFFLE